MHYHSEYSLTFVGSRQRPPCQMKSLWSAKAGDERVPCDGQADMFVWVHSGRGDWDVAICRAMFDKFIERGSLAYPRLGYDHGIALDENGIWRLAPDSKLMR